MTVCRLAIVTVVAFAMAPGAGAAPDRVPEGRIFALHSESSGVCPSLDWHIVVEANDLLAGMIAWNNMTSIARATGKINRADDTFTMTAVEVGGRSRRLTIDGRIDQRGRIVAQLKGLNAACTAVIVPPNIAPHDVQ